MHFESIFSINNQADFSSIALETFKNQFNQIPVYRQFCEFLGKSPETVSTLEDIPFLPIEFFKSHKIYNPDLTVETIFSSSGTTGMSLSRHYVTNISLYRKSFETAFHYFYGNPSDLCILALLPSYQERPGSSLIYMVDHLIRESGNPNGQFLKGTTEELIEKLMDLDRKEKSILLIGVSFALWDLAEHFPKELNNTRIMETGGMKGRRKELVREELHEILKTGFGVPEIHSEYGMTELLSQAYSGGSGYFNAPPWMQFLIRDTEDPMSYVSHGKTGGINVIDLANQNSCSFIATQDLGRSRADGSFEILGRFDHSDIRGCNLMAI